MEFTGIDKEVRQSLHEGFHYEQNLFKHKTKGIQTWNLRNDVNLRSNFEKHLKVL